MYRFIKQKILLFLRCTIDWNGTNNLNVDTRNLLGLILFNLNIDTLYLNHNVSFDLLHNSVIFLWLDAKARGSCNQIFIQLKYSICLFCYIFLSFGKRYFHNRKCLTLDRLNIFFYKVHNDTYFIFINCLKYILKVKII